MPVFLGKDGIHCQDLYMNDPTPAILALRVQEIDQMKSWVKDYYERVHSSTSSSLWVSTASTFLTTSSIIFGTAPVSTTSNSIPTPIWSNSSLRSSTTVTPTTRVPSPTPTSMSYSIPSITYVLPSRSVNVM